VCSFQLTCQLLTHLSAFDTSSRDDARLLSEKILMSHTLKTCPTDLHPNVRAEVMRLQHWLVAHLASLHHRIGSEPPGKSGKLGCYFCLVLSA